MEQNNNFCKKVILSIIRDDWFRETIASNDVNGILIIRGSLTKGIWLLQPAVVNFTEMLPESLMNLRIKLAWTSFT